MRYYWSRDFTATQSYGHFHGVLSQRPKMSETQVKNKNSKDIEIIGEESEIDEKSEDSHKDAIATKKSEHSQTPRSTEWKKNLDGLPTKTAQPRSQLSHPASALKQQQTQQNRAAQIKKSISPFAKFRQLDRENSASNTSCTLKQPGKEFRFKFTDPTVQNNAALIKERLLMWCRAKTKEYENVQLENFSTSWSNGLGFCALLHHFRPNAFDYHSLRPEDPRKNFELAFTKADEIAGIAPLLDVEDMVMMRRPDWKCVFTYVQSIYRRFKDED